MGYLYSILKVHDKELDIKKRVEKISVDKRTEIFNFCRKLRKNDLNSFLQEADRIENLINQGKTLEELKEIYRLEGRYNLDGERKTNGWKYEQLIIK